MKRLLWVLLGLGVVITAAGWSAAASTVGAPSKPLPWDASMVLLAPALAGLGLAGLFRRHRSALAVLGSIGLVLVFLLV